MMEIGKKVLSLSMCEVPVVGCLMRFSDISGIFKEIRKRISKGREKFIQNMNQNKINNLFKEKSSSLKARVKAPLMYILLLRIKKLASSVFSQRAKESKNYSGL